MNEMLNLLMLHIIIIISSSSSSSIYLFPGWLQAECIIQTMKKVCQHW